ncbi:protein LTO1 homolog [Hibiscus syriacus]|uniref:protein LTO1 homolog n=1 Tax=Hibiscus syriacus TaxID=106335 RepID=UPI001924C200|nr:protein LTO1 homolog [Hibiscus syriacus]
MECAEDIFDSSLNLEETHYQEGHKEGFNHGITTGKEEGKEVGLKTGFETGEELGFYKGCVDVWNSAIQVDPTQLSARIQKNIKQMQELIQKYPVMDPENVSVQEIMEALRLKFRVICTGFGVKLEYNGYPKPNDIEF